MKRFFGNTPQGASAFLYTISCGPLTARITDFGAALVQLFVPDHQGDAADVVLGFDSPAEYAASDACFGATVGRIANRVAGASVVIDKKTYAMDANDGTNTLHGGFHGFQNRLWQVEEHSQSAITFRLLSPHMDQGLPGNVDISVCYTLLPDRLVIRYQALSDRQTAINLTNHTYFNLAGHTHPEKAMAQILTMPARHFTPADSHSIPTGECRPVEGTPMDFRCPKPLGRDIGADYAPLILQKGYDHNFEVFCNPCATLCDPESGRQMAVYTDCPGLQLYSANYTDTVGKGGQVYPPRSGVCLETQFYPDALHNPQWAQPLLAAGQLYQSETGFVFHW